MICYWFFIWKSFQKSFKKHSKVITNIDQKINDFFNAFLMDYELQNGSKKAPESFLKPSKKIHEILMDFLNEFLSVLKQNSGPFLAQKTDAPPLILGLPRQAAPKSLLGRPAGLSGGFWLSFWHPLDPFCRVLGIFWVAFRHQHHPSKTHEILIDFLNEFLWVCPSGAIGKYPPIPYKIDSMVPNWYQHVAKAARGFSGWEPCQSWVLK